MAPVGQPTAAVHQLTAVGLDVFRKTKNRNYRTAKCPPLYQCVASQAACGHPFSPSKGRVSQPPKVPQSLRLGVK